MSGRPIDLPEWWLRHHTPEQLAEEVVRHMHAMETYYRQVQQLKEEVSDMKSWIALLESNDE